MRRPVLVVQPLLTGVLLFLQGLLEATDYAFQHAPIPFDLLIGLPLLLCSLLMYLFTLPFVAVFLVELRTGGTPPRSPRFLAGSIAVVVQASYLIWPVHRVLGPATFADVLFTAEDLIVLVVASIATLGFLTLPSLSKNTID